MATNEQYVHTWEASKRNLSDEFGITKGAEVWLAARDLQDFGVATARWLEGDIGHMPTTAYYSHPNDESMPLLPFLNPLNRSAKLVSTFSQPGCITEDRPYGGIMDEQRAAVRGFITEVNLTTLRNLVRDSKVIVLVETAPGSPSQQSHIPVSRNNDLDISYVGYSMSSEDIADRYDGLHVKVIKALQKCFQINMYDPMYGRNDRLWPLLEEFANSDQAQVAQ